jgi:hypothetical protein
VPTTDVRAGFSLTQRVKIAGAGRNRGIAGEGLCWSGIRRVTNHSEVYPTIRVWLPVDSILCAATLRVVWLTFHAESDHA